MGLHTESNRIGQDPGTITVLLRQRKRVGRNARSQPFYLRTAFRGRLRGAAKTRRSRPASRYQQRGIPSSCWTRRSRIWTLGNSIKPRKIQSRTLRRRGARTRYRPELRDAENPPAAGKPLITAAHSNHKYMSIVYAAILLLVLTTAWFLTVVGMPGNWLMVVAAALYAWLVPQDSAASIGWGCGYFRCRLGLNWRTTRGVGRCFRRGQGRGQQAQRRTSAYRLAFGALAGMAVGLPIPLVGPLLAAVFFAGVGAFSRRYGWRTLERPRAGRKLAGRQRRLLGRILGTVAKVLVGSVILALIAVALLV